MVLTSAFRFWFYLVPLIPSILCSIFVLYHLLTQRALRTAINNHVVILMISFGLIYEVTDIVWYIHFFRTGTPLSATPAFCRIWVFIDSAFYVIISMLMAWASIERHILIFHPNWTATKIKCFFVHYLPLTFCSAYPTIFYGGIFLVLPCDIPFDYALPTCANYWCITGTASLSMWDIVANFILPVVVIVLFSVALVARVVYRRCRAHGRIEWRNYRKMAVQLLSISAIYFVFLLPPMVFNAAYAAGLPWDGGSDYYWATQYFGYYTVLLTPFVCIVSLPELRSRWQGLFFFGQRQRVSPTANTATKKNEIQIVAVAVVN